MGFTTNIFKIASRHMQTQGPAVCQYIPAYLAIERRMSYNAGSYDANSFILYILLIFLYMWSGVYLEEDYEQAP